MKKKIIFIGVLFTVILTSCRGGSIETCEKCLIGYDWIDPLSNDPTDTWKFYSDGTFNSSTKIVNNESTLGSWEVVSPNKIKIAYTDRINGRPDNQIIQIWSCNNLEIGTTIYLKY